MKTLIRIPAKHLRKLPDPQQTDGPEEVVYFPARVVDLPVAELSNWKDVNPRAVKDKTSVYQKILATLQTEPEKFYRRNRGLTISAESLRYDTKEQVAEIVFSDKRLHGLIDGGHSLHAAGAVLDTVSEEAFVQVKVILGLDVVDDVVEVAGGLNTSLAVDTMSLENLEGHFKGLQKAIEGEKYAGLIAYKMNEQNAETKPIDVRVILYYAALFDCLAWSKGQHPVALFGRKEGIVKEFGKEFDRNADGTPVQHAYHFKTLFTRITDILMLRDMVEEELIKPEYHLGKLRVRNPRGDSEKVRKERREHRLLFLGKKVKDELALGYLMPMLGGFRANVNWDEPRGSFSWKVPLDELVPLAAPALAQVIMAVHDRERRPEYVGRSSLAWMVCYHAVETAILKRPVGK